MMMSDEETIAQEMRGDEPTESLERDLESEGDSEKAEMEQNPSEENPLQTQSSLNERMSFEWKQEDLPSLDNTMILDAVPEESLKENPSQKLNADEGNEGDISLPSSKKSSKKNPKPKIEDREDKQSKGEEKKMGEVGLYYQEKLRTVCTELPSPQRPRDKLQKLTVMVVGESGLGKTTFINTLFKRELLVKPNEPIQPSTKRIEEHKHLLDNNLEITVIDTPGYGDNVNNEDRIQELISYIEHRLDNHHTKRYKEFQRAEDFRIHCCFYFIAAHRLKGIDIHFIKRLQSRVNVIPVIAKADTMTTSELLQFKKQILQKLEEEEVDIYKFPDRQDTQNPAEIFPPFAVIGSLEKVAEGVPGRSYPWGCALVEDERHCDVKVLRDRIIAEHFYEMKDRTDELFVKYINQPKLQKFANRVYSRYKKYGPQIFVGLIFIIMTLFMLLAISASHYQLTNQHAIFLEGEVARLKVAFQEQHEQESQNHMNAIAYEGKKKRVDLERELEQIRQDTLKELNQMKYDAEVEIQIKKQSTQQGFLILVVGLLIAILFLVALLVNSSLELKKYRSNIKTEYRSPLVKIKRMD